MASTILRPNASYYIFGDVTTVGAADPVAAANDNSDATYVLMKGNGAFVGWDMANIVLAGTDYITHVIPRARVSSDPGQIFGGGHFSLGIFEPGLGTPTASPLYPVGFEVTLDGLPYFAQLDGSALTAAFVNSSQVIIYLEFEGSSFDGRVHEIYLEVFTKSLPVTTVIAPGEGSTVSTTVRPDIDWTYASADGDAQERYRVKLFTAAQYGVGGFNPDTSPNTYDSGEVFSTDTILDGDNLPFLIDGTTYRAYVKTASVGSQGRYSAWDNNQFTVDYVALSAPTLAAAPHGTLPAVVLTATQADHGSLVGPLIYDIQRAPNGTGNWVYVASISGGSFNPALNITFYDFEGNPGDPYIYRIRRRNSEGLVSAWSAATAAVTVTITDAWLIDLPRLVDGYAGLSLRVFQMSPFNRQISEQKGVYHVVGGDFPVVVSDTVGGVHGAIAMDTTTSAEYNTLLGLVQSQRTMVFKTPIDTEQWFIRLVERTLTLIGWSTVDNYRTYAVQYLEQSAPTMIEAVP